MVRKKRRSEVERCIKKVKKKRGVNPFAVCGAALLKHFKTTKSEGHIHKWREDSKFTSYGEGVKSPKHKHRVIKNVALPLFKGGHKHRIIGRN